MGNEGFQGRQKGGTYSRCNPVLASQRWVTVALRATLFG
uniref:Uncharacterized protein n=1 Tax=Lepeophtheirus salmonis TaxID=72036 RepID=A0A0K2UDW4_LEPSM